MLKDLKISSYQYLKEPNSFSSRSGVFGLIEDPPFSDNSQSSPADIVLSPELFRKVNIGSSPCVRIRHPLAIALGDKFRLPQFALYLPDCGWPCSNLPPQLARIDGGITWEKRLHNYFVTLPLQHLFHMLGSKEVCHQLSVFYSYGEHDRHNLVDLASLKGYQAHPRYKANYLGSKVSAFISDQLKIDFPDFSENMAFACSPEFFSKLEDLEFSGQFTGVNPLTLPPPEMWKNAFSDKNYPRTLSASKFYGYLAYWSILYPNKWMRIKDRFASSAGYPGKGNPGYINYRGHPKSAILYSSDNITSAYFSTDGLDPLLNKGLMGRQEVESGYFEGRWRPHERSDFCIFRWAVNANFPKELIRELAIIRTVLERNPELKKGFKFFPFKKLMQLRDKDTHPLVSSTHVGYKDYKVFEQVVALRNALDEASVITDTGQSCPKCREDLRLPYRLVNSRISNKTVCWDCGLKYLTNYINIRIDGSWLFFEDYPVHEAF